MNNLFQCTRKLPSFILLLSFVLSTEVISQTTDKNFLIGKTDYTTDPRFVKLRDEHTTGSAKGGYLLKEVYEAFIVMADSAKKSKITLKIAASARAFDAQKVIWENKWNGKTLVGGTNMTTVSDPATRATLILRSSSMPGTSRYHWGTDIAINSMDETYFKKQEGISVYKWLNEEAARHGFCQPYTSKINGRTGYEEAKWQWSFLPKARLFLNEYVNQVTLQDINGFAGSDVANKINIIDQYVRGVECTDLIAKFEVLKQDGTRKKGYKSPTTVIISPYRYVEMLDFSEGRIAVKSESGWGFADTKGQEIIACQYPAISSFENGRAVVDKGGAMEDWRTTFRYIDAKGNDMGSFFVNLKGKKECAKAELVGSTESGERYAMFSLSNCPNGTMSYEYQGWEWGNTINFYPSTTIKTVITTMANSTGEYASVLKKFKGEPVIFQEGDSKVEIAVMKNKDSSYQSVNVTIASEFGGTTLIFSLEKGGVLFRSNH